MKDQRSRRIQLAAAIVVLAGIVVGILILIYRNDGVVSSRTPASGLKGSVLLSEVPEVEEAKEQLAFRLALPNYLPEGWRLTGVDVEKPPVGGASNAVLYFQGPTGGMQIDESTLRVSMGDNSQVVTVGTVTGQYAEGQAPDGTTRSLVFQTPDGVSIMIASTGLSSDELLRVAASMLT